MARQGNMKFIGTVDNLIYYKWKDIYAVRTKPATVQQTAATIQQSKLFGLAAHAGAKLRSLLKPALPNAKDRKMHRRFEQAIMQWLRSDAYKTGQQQTSLPFIAGFEFNEESLLHNRLKRPAAVGVNADKNIALYMPALAPKRDIAAPAHTASVKIIIRVAACSILNDDSLSGAAHELFLEYNNTPLPAQEIVLPVAAEAGMLAVAVIALQYVAGKESADKRWLPTGVAGGVWGGG